MLRGSVCGALSQRANRQHRGLSRVALAGVPFDPCLVAANERDHGPDRVGEGVAELDRVAYCKAWIGGHAAQCTRPGRLAGGPWGATAPGSEEAGEVRLELGATDECVFDTDPKRLEEVDPGRDLGRGGVPAEEGAIEDADVLRERPRRCVVLPGTATPITSPVAVM